MTRKTILTILEMIAMEFENFNLGVDKEETEKLVDLWQELLADIPDELGIAATKAVLLQSAYRPRIADIRKRALMLAAPESTIDPSEAWGMIVRSIRRYGYMQERAALQELPKVVADAARRMGWRELCEGDENVTRAHFLKMFDSMMTREKEVGVLPPAIQAAIQKAIAAPQKAIIEKPAAALPMIDSAAESPARQKTGYTPPKVVSLESRKMAAAARSRSPEELVKQAEILKASGQQSARPRIETEEQAVLLQQQKAELLRKAS